MLNLGAVNNLAPRTAEDLKNPSKMERDKFPAPKTPIFLPLIKL